MCWLAAGRVELRKNTDWCIVPENGGLIFCKRVITTERECFVPGSLVIGGLDFRLGYRQGPPRLGWLVRARNSSGDTARDAFHGAAIPQCPANLDTIMFIVQHNVRCGIAHAAAGLRLAVAIFNLQFREV